MLLLLRILRGAEGALLAVGAALERPPALLSRCDELTALSSQSGCEPEDTDGFHCLADSLPEPG
eukprot:6079143-Amphidinium_carterae.1